MIIVILAMCTLSGITIGRAINRAINRALGLAA